MKRTSKTAKLPPKLAQEFQTVKRWADQSRTLPSKFWMDSYLRATYELYLQWTQRNVAKKRSRRIAAALGIKITKGKHPLRILLAATSPISDSKILSRWGRALQYAAHKQVQPSRLTGFIRENGGLSGCAQAMAQLDPKRSCERSNKPAVGAAAVPDMLAAFDEPGDVPFNSTALDEAKGIHSGSRWEKPNRIRVVRRERESPPEIDDWSRPVSRIGRRRLSDW